jgi:hypothetical protein
MHLRHAIRTAAAVATLALASLSLGCASSAGDGSPGGAPGTKVAFDLEADFTSPDAFYTFPYPSDLRLGPGGAPIGASFPNPKNKPVLRPIRAAIDEHPGFPLVPVAYFQFDAPMAPRDENDAIAADLASPILLVDVDPKSPTRGKLIPTAATILPWDLYIAESDEVPTRVLAVSARPGFILEGNHTYAFVVRRSLNDAAGKPLGSPKALTDLLDGRNPGGTRGEKALANYAPLAGTLRDVLKVPASEIAAATVFTTGDVVAALAKLGDDVVAKYDVTIDDLTLDVDESTKNGRICVLEGTVNFPQFQKGTPPYDTDGLFVKGADGLPVEQRRERAPAVIAIPKQAMPADGYPLTLYFHGSGGVSRALVDRGAWKPMDWSSCRKFDRGEWEGTKGCFEAGKGPAWVVAPEGIAMAGTALNVNPERLEGAGDYAYANVQNLAAVRDTFRQGVLEQRLFLEALGKLRIPASKLAGCTGATLPAGESAFRFRDGLVSVQGQSMGGLYSNMIGATEPRIGAVSPTGAGGYWSYMFMRTTVFGANTRGLIATLLDASGQLSYMHPAMHAVETAIESADPMVFTPRLAKSPLPGHPVRSIYAPAGKLDSYFPMAVFDAMAIAYGTPQAGTEVWPEMQRGLTLASLDGLRSYPLLENLTSSAGGTKYTGAIVQYEGDGLFDPHALYSQLPAVKHQLRCFHASFHASKKPIIVAPGGVSDPCP